MKVILPKAATVPCKKSWHEFCGELSRRRITNEESRISAGAVPGCHFLVPCFRIQGRQPHTPAGRAVDVPGGALHNGFFLA